MTEPPIRRVALVTGATRGIGLAIAKGLGQAGLCTLIGGRDPATGEAAIKEMQKSGVDAHFLQIDITDDSSVARAARTIETEYRRLDVLINNAAIKQEWHPSAPSEASLAVVRETFETVVAIRLATLGDDGPTGCFFDEHGELPW